MKLYLVRHGQTDWNTGHLVQGRTDNTLNEVGIQQAKDLHDRIGDMQFDICFSSPLTRAYQTAEIIVDGRCKIVTSPLLMERDFGHFEGIKPSEDWMKYWTFSEGDTGVEGMETLSSMFDRARKFLDVIKNNFGDDARILVVSHGGLLKAMHYTIVGYDRETDFLQMHFGNCEMYAYDI